MRKINLKESCLLVGRDSTTATTNLLPDLQVQLVIYIELLKFNLVNIQKG